MTNMMMKCVGWAVGEFYNQYLLNMYSSVDTRKQMVKTKRVVRHIIIS